MNKGNQKKIPDEKKTSGQDPRICAAPDPVQEGPAETKSEAAPAKKIQRVWRRNKIARMEPEDRAELHRKLRNHDYVNLRLLSQSLLPKYDISFQILSKEKRIQDIHDHCLGPAMQQAEIIASIMDRDHDEVALISASVAQALILEMLVGRQELEAWRMQARKSRAHGDKILTNRMERERDRAKAAGEKINEDEPIEIPERAYPTRSDAQFAYFAVRALDAVMNVIEPIMAARKARSAAGGAESANEGGLSPDATAKIRAVLLDFAGLPADKQPSKALQPAVEVEPIAALEAPAEEHG